MIKEMIAAVRSENFIKRMLKGTMMFAAPPTWSASFVPMAVGYVCAYTVGKASFQPIHILWIVLSFIAMIMIETGKHAVNDLFDYRSGDDPAIDEAHLTPVAGGKKVLTQGILSEAETVLSALVTFAIAGVIGLLIVIFCSRNVLWYGIAGIVISIIYTMPPFKLCYRGWGELAVGITYGPLVLLGAFEMFAHEQYLIPFLLSIHIGFLITNVLVINEFPDYEADVSAKKMNLLARIGKKQGCKALLAIDYLSFVPIVVLMFVTKTEFWLASFILMIPMLSAYKIACEHYDDIPQLLKANFRTINLHKWSGVIAIGCVLAYVFVS